METGLNSVHAVAGAYKTAVTQWLCMLKICKAPAKQRNGYFSVLSLPQNMEQRDILKSLEVYVETRNTSITFLVALMKILFNTLKRSTATTCILLY